MYYDGLSEGSSILIFDAILECAFSSLPFYVVFQELSIHGFFLFDTFKRLIFYGSYETVT